LRFVHFGVASERRQALNNQTDIPQLVRELRRRTGLTQEKFAAKLGVTFPTINRWENGRATPSPLAMQRIEELLRSMGDDGVDLLEQGLMNK
jgi:putative transcriptional regulator